MIEMTLPLRGAWIEMCASLVLIALTPSLPLRGAWIEMSASQSHGGASSVAPPAGSVD